VAAFCIEGIFIALDPRIRQLRFLTAALDERGAGLSENAALRSSSSPKKCDVGFAWDRTSEPGRPTLTDCKPRYFLSFDSRYGVNNEGQFSSSTVIVHFPAQNSDHPFKIVAKAKISTSVCWTTL
jgi:hypothetical protein